MPFFLPRRLVEFEYLNGVEKDYEYEEIAKDYQNEIDFAFFVVNFGYSKEEYESLTAKEKLFIYKAYENKIVTNTTLIRDSVLNAINNALRKKGKKFQALWKKKQKLVDKDILKEHLKIVEETEAKEGKSWVDKIYKANRLKKPKRREITNG